MKLFNCLVHLDEPKACTVRDVEVPSIDSRQGKASYYGTDHIVEYVGKGGGTLIFKEVKPKDEETWLL